MAQTESPTTKLYVACSSAMSGGTNFDTFSHIGLEEGSMAGFDETTTALTTISTKSGLGIVSATVTQETETVTNDTVQATHEFTAGEAATINGFGVFPGGANEDMLMWCTFNASQALEEDDKLSCTGKAQFKKGT